MPWHVVEGHAKCGEGRFGVVKDDGGELDSCHDSREAAEAHVEMLYDREEMDGEHGGKGMMRTKLSAASINDLDDDQFAYIEPGGRKDDTGRTVPRSLRHFPVHDAEHVRNALARAPQSPFGSRAMRKIRAAAKKFGVAVAGKEPAGRSRTLGPCVRAFDFEFRGKPGDGRTLEGYVAVFGATARISDRDGDFDEEIHRGAFDRSLARSLPVMQFDHGRDTRVGSVPIGVYDVFEPDDHGYYVRGRLFDNPVVEPVRQAIEGRAIKGMSWRMLVPKEGQKWTRRTGDVDKRDVHDADVPESGPVVFPAYDATRVSVRSLLATMNPDEIRALVAELYEHLGQAVDLRVAVDLPDGRDLAAAVERHALPPATTTDLTGRPTSGDAGGGDQDPAAEDGARSTSFDPRTRDRVLQARGVL